MPNAPRSRTRSKLLSLLPPSVGRWLRRRALRLTASPPVGSVDLGDLMRAEPISRGFGMSRGGVPIDRLYIERFLQDNAVDVRGHVLEVADDAYSRRYGHDLDRVDVLHLRPGPGVTLVADLAEPGDLPWGVYDCVVLTQTLQFVREPDIALRTVYRLLRQDGVLLATVPGISQISRYDADRWGDRWRFTAQSAQELSTGAFGPGGASVKTYGNVLAAVGLLHGLVVDDLPPETFAEDDPEYAVIIAIRGVRR
jgi:SAM-dependent methyltransferase